MKRGLLIGATAVVLAWLAMAINGHTAPSDALLGTENQTFRVDPSDGSKIPKVWSESAAAGGTGFYAIERTNITTASVNLAFGLTSKKVKIVAPTTNTFDICIDYAGGTAACPAANTAGHDRLKPGTSLILDDFHVTSVSVIAASGTQSIQVTAWQ